MSNDTVTAANDSPDLISMTADIVSAYVAHNSIPAAELPGLVAGVHASLAGLTTPAEATPEPLVPPVPIRKTVTPDAIISLEDGRPYKTLKRHLAGRGMTPEQYRAKWGLPPNYPMVAANYAAQRSELAKNTGLGTRRAAARSTARDETVSDKPTRRGGKRAE
ncbi:MucR family transcriptional regulator [Methylobacterium nodulans]|uniref:Transcriptional regulator, MucR family n=1 Tax=Methylobacterium nodulans (strain LMG 21967 / CNCM I-2342 / ORS 2060) TaxID=460265 RepID=B8IUK8_METNO|nr:MucR family transcriptional regulator [Methylobacterium nodulans]ACL57076.1 transcriptional regulator, MucR family [Methylobacterium nodulans ORS 2060]